MRHWGIVSCTVVESEGAKRSPCPRGGSLLKSPALMELEEERPWPRMQLRLIRMCGRLFICTPTNAIAIRNTDLLFHRIGRICFDSGGRGRPTSKTVLQGTQVGLLELCGLLSIDATDRATKKHYSWSGSTTS